MQIPDDDGTQRLAYQLIDNLEGSPPRAESNPRLGPAVGKGHASAVRFELKRKHARVFNKSDVYLSES